MQKYATLLHGLKTELVEDEDMGGEKEEPAEAGLNKKEKEKEKKTQKKSKRKMSLRILRMALMAPQEAQEEPVVAQEALVWGLLWWLQLEKAKAAKKKACG